MDLGRILDGEPEPAQPMSLMAYNTQDTSGDYTLRVPMTQMQKELTDQVVSSHYSDTLKFFNSMHEPLVADSLDTLCQNLQLVATHPFLLIDHYMPRNLLLKDVPSKLAIYSGKFAILGQVIEISSPLKLRIALIARPGKCMDLLEAFLLGKHINYYRYSGTNLRDQGPPDNNISTVYLIPSDATSVFNVHSMGFFAGGHIDLILAFDSTFEKDDPHLKWLQNYNRSRPAAILRLVPANTIEHVTLCQPFVDNEEGERLRYVLAAAVVLRGKVGAISTDFSMIYKHGLTPLKTWFEDSLRPWPLPPLPIIPKYSAEDVEKALLTEVTHTNIYASSNRFGIGSSASGDNSNGSLVSLDALSSAHNRSQSPDVRNADFYAFKKQKRDEDYIWPSFSEKEGKETNHEPLGKDSSLEHQVLMRLGELLELTSQQAKELESHRSLASERQNLIESLREELGERISQAESVESRIRMAERKAERCQMDTARAREQQEQASLELSETRRILEDDHPEKAIVDNQRREIEELKAELKRCNEKVDARTSENDYMRSEYQRASGAAAEAQAKVELLEAENKDIKRKLELDVAKLRQISFDEERKVKDTLIEEQSTRLFLLEEQLQRMMNVEKTGLGRRGTARASSVPRNEKSQTPK